MKGCTPTRSGAQIRPRGGRRARPCHPPCRRRGLPPCRRASCRTKLARGRPEARRCLKLCILGLTSRDAMETRGRADSPIVVVEDLKSHDPLQGLGSCTLPAAFLTTAMAATASLFAAPSFRPAHPRARAPGRCAAAPPTPTPTLELTSDAAAAPSPRSLSELGAGPSGSESSSGPGPSWEEPSPWWAVAALAGAQLAAPGAALAEPGADSGHDSSFIPPEAFPSEAAFLHSPPSPPPILSLQPTRCPSPPGPSTSAPSRSGPPRWC